MKSKTEHKNLQKLLKRNINNKSLGDCRGCFSVGVQAVREVLCREDFPATFFNIISPKMFTLVYVQQKRDLL